MHLGAQTEKTSELEDILPVRRFFRATAAQLITASNGTYRGPIEPCER